MNGGGATRLVKTMGIAQPTVPTASEEAVVRSLYDRMMDGWNRESGAAFAAPFDEELRLHRVRWHAISRTRRDCAIP
jgi:hypothetical protein